MSPSIKISLIFALKYTKNYQAVGIFWLVIARVATGVWQTHDGYILSFFSGGL